MSPTAPAIYSITSRTGGRLPFAQLSEAQAVKERVHFDLEPWGRTLPRTTDSPQAQGTTHGVQTVG